MVLPFLLAVAIVILSAKLSGWASNLINQPTVLGKLLIGLILGPSLFNIFGSDYFHSANVNEILHLLGELGVILLMFVAGLEIDLNEMRKSGLAATLVGTSGVIVPMILGALTSLAFGYGVTPAIFIGVVLTATSVSISAQTLMELGRLRSRAGLTILGAAVVDDVLGIAVLSAFVALALGGEGGGIGSIVLVVVQMLVFLGVAALAAFYVVPRILDFSKRMPVSQPMMATLFVLILLYAWASETWGQVAPITGAFVLGAGLSGSRFKHDIEQGIHATVYALFVPIFLVNIGLTADLTKLSSNDIGLTIAICLVAIVSKIIGCGAGAKLSGMTWKESLRIGVGMISRGEVGLIVAGVGVTKGVIGNNVFTVSVVMVLVSTLVTPPLLRLVFQDVPADNEPSAPTKAKAAAT
ncbi:MAG: cation:proton antiporter [Caldilineaceae bacterium]